MDPRATPSTTPRARARAPGDARDATHAARRPADSTPERHERWNARAMSDDGDDGDRGERGVSGDDDAGGRVRGVANVDDDGHRAPRTHDKRVQLVEGIGRR